MTFLTASASYDAFFLKSCNKKEATLCIVAYTNKAIFIFISNNNDMVHQIKSLVLLLILNVGHIYDIRII